MSHDERALLVAVLKYPEENLPRLIYADWLTEQGRDRHSQFIQQQIAGELAVLPLTVYGPICDGLAPGGRSHRSSRGESVVRMPNANVTLAWRRGLLEEVRCPLEFWMGGRTCPACRGHGQPDYGEWVCRTCRGRGRLIGHGPSFVATHPVARVLAADREPATLADGVCWREDPGRDFLLEVLPAGLIEGWEYTSPGGGYRRKTYPDREAAFSDLSAGLIRWAKRNPPPV